MAAFFDGLSAKRRDATLDFEAEALAIRDPSGAMLARWPYTSLRAVERLAAGREGRVASLAAPDARLLLEAGDPSARLCALAPQLSRRGDALSWRAVAGAAALAVAMLAALYHGLPLAAGPIAKLIPIEWEAALGRRVAGVMAAGGACDAPDGVAALEKLAARLARASEFESGFRVSVVADPRVNAFAAPGGQIVLFAGLLEKAGSPEEAAGVLAHEIGHVIERHPTAATLRLLGLQALLEGMLGDGSVLISAAASAGGLLAALSYSRDDERAADRLAAELLDRAGISRAGLLDFFERVVEERGDGAPLAYLSTHPAPAERRAPFEGAAPRPSPLSPEEWAALKAICD
jgi:predicted Zn-dependent protease